PGALPPASGPGPAERVRRTDTTRAGTRGPAGVRPTTPGSPDGAAPAAAAGEERPGTATAPDAHVSPHAAGTTALPRTTTPGTEPPGTSHAGPSTNAGPHTPRDTPGNTPGSIPGDTPAPLPRRLPRRESAPGAAPGDALLIPRARTEADPAPSGAARPLRRRVRGATLRTTLGADAERHAARQAVPPADAEAVRDALEEFEAAVERAHRDSNGTGIPRPDLPRTPSETPDPHTRNEPTTNPPEGAES
ncbi:histidine kinase, partial [Streptomyces sp. NPDC052676]